MADINRTWYADGEERSETSRISDSHQAVGQTEGSSSSRRAAAGLRAAGALARRAATSRKTTNVGVVMVAAGAVMSLVPPLAPVGLAVLVLGGGAALGSVLYRKWDERARAKAQAQASVPDPSPQSQQNVSQPPRTPTGRDATLIALRLAEQAIALAARTVEPSAQTQGVISSAQPIAEPRSKTPPPITAVSAASLMPPGSPGGVPDDWPLRSATPPQQSPATPYRKAPQGNARAR